MINMAPRRPFAPYAVPLHLEECTDLATTTRWHCRQTNIQSDSQLAIIIDESPQKISNVFRGKQQDVDIYFCVKLCWAFCLDRRRSEQLLAMYGRALCPSNDLHRIYLEIIDMYAADAERIIALPNEERLQAAYAYMRSTTKRA